MRYLLMFLFVYELVFSMSFFSNTISDYLILKYIDEFILAILLIPAIKYAKDKINLKNYAYILYLFFLIYIYLYQ